MQSGLNQTQRRYLNVAVIGQAPANSNITSNTAASFFQEYPSGLLDKSKDWVVGIVRFSIPMFNVPIFMDPQFDNPTNPAIIAWYNTTYFPNGLFSTVTVPYTVDPDNPNYVYTDQSWIDALQSSMNSLAAQANLTGATWNGLPIVPPLITYSQSSQLITIQAQSGLFYPSPAITGTYAQQPIYMYLNPQAYRFLPTIPTQELAYTDPRQYALVRMGGTTSLPNWSAPLATALVGYGVKSGNEVGLLGTGGAVTANTWYGSTQVATSTEPVYPGQLLGISTGATYAGIVATMLASQYIGRGGTNVLIGTAPFISATACTAGTGSVWLISGVNTIEFIVPAGYSIPTGTSLTLQSATHTQIVVTTAQANAGDTTVSVQPFYPNFNYPTTTLVYPTLPTYDQIVTETAVPSTWTSISSIRMTSQFMNIEPELAPAIVVPGQNTNASVMPTVNMLTDFTVQSGNIAVTRDVLTFVTDQPRWIDMKNDRPLNKIDLNLQWVDLLGNSHQIYLSQGERLDVKIAFRRKYTQSGAGF